MFEDKIKELGMNIPEAPKPLAAYVAANRVYNLIFTAGQLPLVGGKLTAEGKVGIEVSEGNAKKAAEVCAINCRSAVKSLINNLDNIEKIVKLTVFVASAEGFTNQPVVANGASELMVKIFGESGKHARSAVGVSELPLNASSEIEMIVKVKN